MLEESRFIDSTKHPREAGVVSPSLGFFAWLRMTMRRNAGPRESGIE